MRGKCARQSWRDQPVTAARSEALPDLPTVGEFLPGFEASLVYDLGAPKNTPAEIVNKLNKEINAGRGRDASYLAPPAQIRTCGFPAYGSHLGYRRQRFAVDEPAPLTRLCGSKSGACFAGPHSHWSPLRPWVH